MKIFGNIIAFIASFGLLGLIVWGGYLGIRFLVEQFGMIDSREMPVLVISSLVYLAGAAMVAGAIRSSFQWNDKNVHPEKTALYSRILNDWNAFDGDRQQFAKQTTEWFPHMQLWAGDEVLKQYQQLRLSLNKADSSEETLQQHAGKLLLEMRKDLGHKNRGISSQLLVNRK